MKTMMDKEENKEDKEIRKIKSWHINVIGVIVTIVMLGCFGVLMYGIATDTFWDWNAICEHCNCTVQQ